MAFSTAAGAAVLSNETLFESCKIYMAIGDAGESTEAQRLAGTQCVAYMGGAVQVYNFTKLDCKMDSKTINTTIADYLQFSTQSAFGKFFRQKTGVSPRDYRNKP